MWPEIKKIRCYAQAVVLSNPKSSVIQLASSFAAAKKQMREVYGVIDRSFYCHCKITFPVIDIVSCDLKDRIVFKDRYASLAYEHVVPAALLKKKLLRVSNTIIGASNCLGFSRRCFRRGSELFKSIEGDLHNIRPVVGRLNLLRGDKKITNLKKMSSRHKCNFKVSKLKFEPPDFVKGDVARIYLYMDKKYPELSLLNDGQKTIFKSWSLLDKVDVVERAINKRIMLIQGDSNSFIK